MHEAFLDAILANPEDDTHRLIYADWLEEHGDEKDIARAHLIRAQCAIEHLEPGDCKRAALEQEVKHLLKAHSKDWLRAARKAKLGGSWKFRRGFLEETTLSAANFTRVAEKLFRLVPTLRSVCCPDASNEVSALAACPHLARVSELTLDHMCACGYCPIGRELAELFESPHVVGLRCLSLVGDRLGSEGAERLANAPNLAGLTHLNLASNRLGNAGARALIDSPHLRHIVHLDLRFNGIGPRVSKAVRERFGKGMVSG